MKVIQLLHHSLTPFKSADPLTYRESWHIKVAEQLVEQSEHDIDVECWRPECTIEEAKTKVDQFGITHRLFPSTYVNFKLENSRPLLSELKCLTNEESILHTHGIYNFFFYNLLREVGDCTNIVAQSHGELPAHLQISRREFWPVLSGIVEYLPQSFTFDKVDHFFALTQEERDALSRYATTTVSPMGVDFGKYQPMDQEEARGMFDIDFRKDYNINYIGRHEKQKGLDLLIKAVPRLIDSGINIQLNIAGTGEYRDKLEKEIHKRGLEEYVELLGFIENRLKVPFYNSGDLTVFPSKSEPYGIVPIESLACEVPVVASDVGAVPEIADTFGGIVVVEPNDVNSLVSGIGEALTEKQLSIDRQNGELNHSWKQIMSDTLSLYQEMLGHNDEY